MDTRRASGSAVDRSAAAAADRAGRVLRHVEQLAGEQAGSPGLDGGLLRDAATVLLTRRVLDGLLVQLTAAPSRAADYDGLRSYLAGLGRPAQAPYASVCASPGLAGR
jgi:hypothetical protein